MKSNYKRTDVLDKIDLCLHILEDILTSNKCKHYFKDTADMHNVSVKELNDTYKFLTQFIKDRHPDS